MEEQLQKYVPDNWELFCGEQTVIGKNTTEYFKIKEILDTAQTNCKRTLSRLVRVQNINQFGQYLLREQFIMAVDKSVNYYRVRRFVQVSKIQLNMALKYNLDSRRLQCPDLTFTSNIDQIDASEVVFIVQIVTNAPYEAVINPTRSTDFFIEYIAYFD